MARARALPLAKLCAALALASGWACGSNTSPIAAACVPGRTVPCSCAGGGQGIQSCLPDGTGFEACDFCGVPRDGFKNVTAELGLPQAAGSCIGFEDFDGDEKLDLILATTGVPSQLQLYPGRGDGTFGAPATTLPSFGFANRCAVGDIDNDGLPDIIEVVGGVGSGTRIGYWKNLGNFKFENNQGAIDAPDMPDQLVVGMGVWDYDHDGWLDLVVGRLGATLGGMTMDCKFTSDADYRCLLPMANNNPAPLVFHNDKGKLSLAKGVLAGPYPATTNAMAFADLDRDGRVDLFMSNDYFIDHLHLQTSKSKFQHAETARAVDQYNHGMGVAIADFNGDGLLDIYGADLGPNNVWFGTSDGAMINRSLELGVAQATHFHSNWAPIAEDFDLDGRVDVFVASAAAVDNDTDMAIMATSQGLVQSLLPQYDLLFWNEGASFSSEKLPRRVGQLPNVIYGVAAVGDPDGDGDLDLAVAVGNPLEFRFLRNEQRPSNFLIVDVEGTSSNRDGIGVEVELVRDGNVVHFRTIGSQGSLGQSWRRAHFGLGLDDDGLELQVRWPTGKLQKLGPVTARQTIAVKEAP